MKLSKYITAVAVIAVLMFATDIMAQRGQGRGMRHARNQQARLYNVNTVATFSGEVVSVETRSGKGGSQGLHAQLKTGDGTYDLHLGPQWHLNDIGMDVKEGSELTVTGSKITYNGSPAIIANDVKVSGKEYDLRDDQGYPVWRGSGRGMQRPNRTN